MRTISESRAFDGVQGVHAHDSAVCGCEMTFGLFLPPAARRRPVPVLWYLSGLTCTHENAMLKSGAQAHAARHGIALVFPDTSPRGAGVADADAFDLGQGAGFYVDATEAPWAGHFRMWSYLADELPALLAGHFPLDLSRQAITGHSMGGHGALTRAMGCAGRFASVSAFAPIAHPSASEWGRKQFTAYLGADEARWAAHDAVLRLRAGDDLPPLLVDQGAGDQFLDRLMPEELFRVVAARRLPARLRMRPGHDHSYFFVASFIEDHLAFHAEALLQ